MVEYEYMSDRARLKYATRRVEAYLVCKAVGILGHQVWMARYHMDPGTTSTEAMPIYLFAVCAQTIVNDRVEASLIPNHILCYLKDAIYLRNAEVARWKSLAENNSEVQKIHDRHIAFNAVLKDVLRMFDLALKPAPPDHAMTVATGNAIHAQNVSQGLDDPGITISTQSTNQPEISSEIDADRQDMADTGASLESASTHTVLVYLHHLSLLSRDVLDIWDGVMSSNMSVNAIGFITGFAFHLIQRTSSKFEISEAIPAKQLSNCPDAGLLGIIYDLYSGFEGQKSDPRGDVDQDKALWDVADQLSMPTIGAYLALWVDSSEEMDEFLQGSDPMPKLSFASISEDAGLEHQALYNWRSTTALHLLRVFKQMGKFEDRRQLSCYRVADVLTRSLPKDLWNSKVAAWEALAVRLLIGVLTSLNLSHCQTLPGCALIDTGHHARRETSAGLSQLKPTSAPHFHEAKSLTDSMIFSDPLEALGRIYEYQPPSNFKLQNMPALNGSLSQAILGELGAGVAAAEKAAPIMTATAILYRALFSIGALKHCWHDMEYLIAFYGQEAIFNQLDEPTDLQDFYERSKQVLTTNAQRLFVQLSEFQQLLQRYTQDCSTEAFRSLLHYIETVPKQRKSHSADSSEQQADGIFESFRDWVIHNWETHGERSPDDASEHESEEPESMSSTMVEPSTPTWLRLGQSEVERVDEDTKDDPRKVLEGLGRLMQSHDIVTHMDNATFWLECHDIVDYIKKVYVNCTGSQPFTNSEHTYRYVWLFLEFMYRNPHVRDAIVEPVAQTLRGTIAESGRNHLKHATKLSGIDWKQNRPFSGS